ncbi:hypothetical protein EBT25_00530 [bacterium]|nr:hypothetical protein [bacterium]
MATIIDPTDDLRYEVVQIKNYDNVPIKTTTDPGTGTKPASLDAFGRLRVSNPLTLFDSSHRYRDNNLWNTSTASGGAATFNQDQGLINLTVNTTSGSKVYRETTKVFSYQPGKSLLVMDSFVFEPAKVNLRQRVGYFGDANGMYLELDGAAGNVLALVERSSVSGSPVETRITQANWNTDKLDGTGPSGITLDITKAQILWMDIEWLGLGTVRMGFVIDGKFIICHQFHHANLITSTYITTGSLPLRYEIENLGITTSNSTLKQICSTVLSEGGYELRGLQQGIGTPITTPTNLILANTYYPLISLRLKTSPNRLDAIVILTALSIMGITNNANYNWQIIASGTTTGGTWASAGTDSAVEYNITGTGFSGGRILAQGFLSASNQSVTAVDILKEALFKFQLERNTFTATPFEITVVAASASTNTSIYAALDWEECSR